MVQEGRLIFGTALLQPLEFILRHSSTHPSIFHMQRSLMGTVPSFLLHCYISLPPPYTLASTVYSTPLHHPSIIYFCLSSCSSLTVNLSSSVSPSVFLSVLLPSSLSKVREGASVPGEMLFVFGGRGEGLHRIRGEGIRSGKGMKGRMGKRKVRLPPAA